MEQNNKNIDFKKNIKIFKKIINKKINKKKDIDLKTSVLMQDEIFGPILPIIKYNDLDQIIENIKTNEKPLALYIFARNEKNIDKYEFLLLLF
jgi:delta 1-pyrroline-5-carboxylate dehydrogenase